MSGPRLGHVPEGRSRCGRSRRVTGLVRERAVGRESRCPPLQTRGAPRARPWGDVRNRDAGPRSSRAPPATRLHPRARWPARARGHRGAALPRRREVDPRRLPRRRRVLRDQRLPDHVPAPRPTGASTGRSGSRGSGSGGPGDSCPRSSPCSSWCRSTRCSSSPTSSTSCAGEVIAALLYVENWFLIFRDLSYFAARGTTVAAAARVVARGRGAVLPPLAAHPHARAHGLGQAAATRCSSRVARRRARVDGRDGGALRAVHRSVARLLRHRHARRHVVARRRARVRLGTVAADRQDRPKGAPLVLDAVAVPSASSAVSGCSSTPGSSTRALPRRVPAASRSCRRCSSRRRCIPRHGRAVVLGFAGLPVDRRALVRHLPLALADLHGHPAALRRADHRHPAPRAPPGPHLRCSRRSRTGTSRSRSATARSDAAGREYRTATGESAGASSAPGSRVAGGAIGAGVLVITAGSSAPGRRPDRPGCPRRRRSCSSRPPRPPTPAPPPPPRRRHRAAPRSRRPPRRAPAPVAARVTAIGDSVMLGAAQARSDTIRRRPRCYVDADARAGSSRPASTSIQAYQDPGQLGEEVVVQLGTNGTVDPGRVRPHDGDPRRPVQKVVIVNAKVPRPWEEQVNARPRRRGQEVQERGAARLARPRRRAPRVLLRRRDPPAAGRRPAYAQYRGSQSGRPPAGPVTHSG